MYNGKVSSLLGIFHKLGGNNVYEIVEKVPSAFFGEQSTFNFSTRMFALIFVRNGRITNVGGFEIR
jgi:hypothetical protein